MAKKQHISRLAVPASWPTERKGKKWIAKPSPGSHDIQHSLPLVVWLRDILKLTKTVKETKKILNKGLVEVNWSVRKDANFPVGLFDVLAIPSLNKYWRVLLNRKGKMRLIEIPGEDAKIILWRIDRKTPLKKGKLQLGFCNGWTIFADKKDYSIGDTIIFDMHRKPARHLKLTKGAIAYIIGGKHVSETAKLKELKQEGVLRKKKIAVLESEKETFETGIKNLLVVGGKEAEIKLG